MPLTPRSTTRRKAAPAKRKRKLITLRLRLDLLERATRRAERDRRSRSSMIEDALEIYLNENSPKLRLALSPMRARIERKDIFE